MLSRCGQTGSHQGVLCVTSGTFALAILRLTEEKEKPFVEKHLANS